MTAYLERFTADDTRITPCEANREGFFDASRPARNNASFTVQGELIRWYKNAEGERRLLTDRMTITGSIEWLPADEAEQPMGVCDVYVYSDTLLKKAV